MSAIEELRQRLEAILKMKEDGGKGYDPCIAFYTRLIDEIQDLHLENIDMEDHIGYVR